MSGTLLVQSGGEDQLRRRFRAWRYGDHWLSAFDEALAAHRLAAVELIRARLISGLIEGDPSDIWTQKQVVNYIDGIFDEDPDNPPPNWGPGPLGQQGEQPLGESA